MILIIIISLYVIVIGYFIIGFNRLKSTSEIESTENLIAPFTKFSIIIPFRNEAKRLPQLLNSLSKLNYPKDCFEVLLINDASTDESFKTIENFRKKNLNISIYIYDNQRTSAAPKKDAITLAIAKAKYEWVLTTDADCMLPSTWLDCYHDFICNNNVAFVAGPVMYKTGTSFIDQFQLLDVLSLQGITMGSFGHQKGLFCNGANLAYTKTLFNKINGFTNNNTIASGDDIFMLENAQTQFPEKVGYLKSRLAVVETFPETSWATLISQRTRWAKKTAKQNNSGIKAIGILVFLTNLIILATPFLILTNFINIWLGFSVLCIKFLIDFMLLHKAGRFFRKRISVVKVITHFYLYAIISTWIVVQSPFVTYTWKDRKHSH